MQASSILAGFHSAMPYLIFDGTAAEAIAFYCEAFGATELPGRLTDPSERVWAPMDESLAHDGMSPHLSRENSRRGSLGFWRMTGTG